MKKIILLLFAILMAVTSYGNPFWWGYFSEANANLLPYSSNLGYGSAKTLDAAIYIPANHSVVGNGTIKALRFWLGDDISQIGSDITVWISSTLPESATSADYSQTIPKANVTSRLNEVELTTPFSVNNAGFYVGYTFDISGKSYPVMSYGSDVAGAFYYRYTGSSWLDFYGEGYGTLALQLLIDGVTLPEYSVSVTDFKTAYVQKGQETSVSISITNNGSQPVTSVSYTITGGSSSGEERISNVSSLTSFASTTIEIPFASDAETKKYIKTLTITKVNGQPNTSTQNVGTGSLITISELPVSVPVVEEFTGTWCGWCVYGYTGMEKANEEFGDKVVLIAAHGSDPMAISDYSPIRARVSGYPSSFINREDDVYPSAGNLRYYLNYRLNRVTVGSIAANAVWANDDKTGISINTQTKFVYSDDNGQYGIAYVLIADGLKDESWGQSNYLNGSSGSDETMSFWYTAGSTVYGLEYNHVAVGAWDIAEGVSGSVNSTITANEVQDYTFDADISSKSLIQDKSKLKVAVLLIDRSTGLIVNAAKTDIKEKTPTGINTVAADGDDTDATWYDLNGRRLAGKPAVKGIYVKNGKKVVIR